MIKQVLDYFFGPTAEVREMAEAVASMPEPSPRRVLVVAGNYRQAAMYARDAGWRNWHYVNTVDRFAGYRPDTTDIAFRGTYWDAPDYLEIQYWATAMGFAVV